MNANRKRETVAMLRDQMRLKFPTATVDLPRCPACKSYETTHELADRWGCGNCGWEFIVNDRGEVRDFMPWTTAGRKRGRR